MTTQEKLQAILSKHDLTCKASNYDHGHFYIIDCEGVVADFDTTCKSSLSYFCDYDRLPEYEITEIEQEWLKVAS